MLLRIFSLTLNLFICLNVSSQYFSENEAKQALIPYVGCKINLKPLLYKCSIIIDSSMGPNAISYNIICEYDSSKIENLNKLMKKKLIIHEPSIYFKPDYYYVIDKYKYEGLENSTYNSYSFNLSEYSKEGLLRDSNKVVNDVDIFTFNPYDYDCVNESFDVYAKQYHEKLINDISQEKIALKKKGFSNAEIYSIQTGKVLGMSERALNYTLHTSNIVATYIDFKGKKAKYYYTAPYSMFYDYVIVIDGKVVYVSNKIGVLWKSKD